MESQFLQQAAQEFMKDLEFFTIPRLCAGNRIGLGIGLKKEFVLRDVLLKLLSRQASATGRFLSHKDSCIAFVMLSGIYLPHSLTVKVRIARACMKSSLPVPRVSYTPQ